MIRPEALDESRIEDLIGQHLQHNLEILPEQVRDSRGRCGQREDDLAPRPRVCGACRVTNSRAPSSMCLQTLTEALHEFVEKDNKDSMKDAIARVLHETQVLVRAGGAACWRRRAWERRYLRPATRDPHSVPAPCCPASCSSAGRLLVGRLTLHSPPAPPPPNNARSTRRWPTRR